MSYIVIRNAGNCGRNGPDRIEVLLLREDELDYLREQLKLDGYSLVNPFGHPSPDMGLIEADEAIVIKGDIAGV